MKVTLFGGEMPEMNNRDHHSSKLDIAVGLWIRGSQMDTTEDDSGGVTIWRNGGLNYRRKNAVLYHLGGQIY